MHGAAGRGDQGHVPSDSLQLLHTAPRAGRAVPKDGPADEVQVAVGVAAPAATQAPKHWVIKTHTHTHTNTQTHTLAVWRGLREGSGAHGARRRAGSMVSAGMVALAVAAMVVAWRWWWHGGGGMAVAVAAVEGAQVARRRAAEDAPESHRVQVVEEHLGEERLAQGFPSNSGEGLLKGFLKARRGKNTHKHHDQELDQRPALPPGRCPYVPPRNSKSGSPAHTKHPGWYLEFEFPGGSAPPPGSPASGAPAIASTIIGCSSSAPCSETIARDHLSVQCAFYRLGGGDRGITISPLHDLSSWFLVLVKSLASRSWLRPTPLRVPLRGGRLMCPGGGRVRFLNTTFCRKPAHANENRHTHESNTTPHQPTDVCISLPLAGVCCKGVLTSRSSGSIGSSIGSSTAGRATASSPPPPVSTSSSSVYVYGWRSLISAPPPPPPPACAASALASACPPPPPPGSVRGAVSGFWTK